MDYLFFIIYVLIFLTISIYFCLSVKYFSIKYKKVEIKRKGEFANLNFIYHYYCFICF